MSRYYETLFDAAKLFGLTIGLERTGAETNPNMRVVICREQQVLCQASVKSMGEIDAASQALLVRLKGMGALPPPREPQK